MTRIALLLVAAALTLAAQQKPPEPCKDAAAHPEFRGLDFWIGDWDVFAGPQKVGESHVEPILKNCVIYENWTGGNGSSGKSFNIYNPALKKWQQYWVQDTGNAIYFLGDAKDGELVYTAEARTQKGEPYTRKMTFTRLPDGKVRQFSQRSMDGKNWNTEYDFVYAPRK